MKRVRWLLAWPIAFLVSGCNCNLDIPDVSASVEPPCGHVDGNYDVTVSVDGAVMVSKDGEEVRLDDVESIKIAPPGDTPTTRGAAELEVTETSISFVMPSSSKPGTATIYGYFRLEGKFRGTNKRGKECWTKKLDGLHEVPLAQFEYVDDPLPVISDADLEPTGGCPDVDIPNPNPGQGDSCGGYYVTIRGSSFAEDVQLFWGGEELAPEQYSREGSGEIQVTVPRGDMGTSVEFYVVNPAEECPLESNVGCFYYTQEPCDFPEETVFTIYPDARVSGAVYVAIGSVLGGPDNDVVAALQLPGGIGSLRIFEGNGDGTLADVIAPGTALDFAEGMPLAVELGKFDDNEFADAVVALQTPAVSGRVTIFLNDGTGYSNDPDRKISLDLAQIPEDMIVADLDGDGTDDLLVGSAYTPAELVGYRQSSVGVLEAMPGIAVPGGDIFGVLALAAGDFDGRGAKDVACLSQLSSVALLASGDEHIWSPSAAWAAELAVGVGDGNDLATLPDATETGDDLLLLDRATPATYLIEVSADGSGLTMSEGGWALRRGETPLMMAVGLFTSPSSAYGVAVGHNDQGVEVLLVPYASVEDSRYTESLSISDVATGFLDGDKVMDVAFGTRGSPSSVRTLVIK